MTVKDQILELLKKHRSLIETMDKEYTERLDKSEIENARLLEKLDKQNARLAKLEGRRYNGC